MIFETVTLYNFGIYKGEHSVDLNSTEHTKPIILLGGLNGGGKTTFLDSLQLALYGKHAKCSNRDRLSYSDYLKQTINRYTDDKSASVSLTFRHSKGTKHNRYEIKRSWTLNGNKDISDIVKVFVDNKKDNLLTDSWDDFVSEFIPQNMSELFFFDGEKIENLADPIRSAQLIKTGIEALLGLDLFSQLAKDLNTQRQRRQERSLDKKATVRVAELTERKKTIESNLRVLDTEIAKTINNRDELDDKLLIADLKMQSSGAHLLHSLSEVQAERKGTSIQIEITNSNLHKIASSALPLFMAKKLFTSTFNQAKKEYESLDYKNAEKHIKAQNSQLIKLLNETDKNTASYVKQLLNNISLEIKNETVSINRYLNTNPAVFEFATSGIENEISEAKSIIDSKNELIEKLALFDNKLDAIPDYDSVKDLIRKKESLLLQLDQNKHHLEAILEERNQCKNQLHENEAKLDATLIQQNSEIFEHQRNQQVADHLIEMKDIVDAFKSKMITENISSLEKAIKHKFYILGRKEILISKVKIDPQSFNITLFDIDHKSMDAKRLSAGERQLFSIAILWALADKSKKEIPTIIDTPMGRLDGEHRTKLVENYLPNAAGQVILLSTDEEISGKYYQKLKPSISKEYHISYDESTRTSTIKPGYFGGQS